MVSRPLTNSARAAERGTKRRDITNPKERKQGKPTAPRQAQPTGGREQDEHARPARSTRHRSEGATEPEQGNPNKHPDSLTHKENSPNKT